MGYWFSMFAVIGVVVMAVFGAIAFLAFCALSGYAFVLAVQMMKARIAEYRARTRQLTDDEWKVHSKAALAAVRNGSLT